MTLPTWLKDRIGGPTRRGVTAHRCPTCKASILTGLDADECALRATVDPNPLTPLGEALALLAGRHSYELRRYSGGMALYRRDRWQIAGRIASTKHYVVAEHECDAAPLPHFDIPSPASSKKARTNAPPF